MKAQGAGTESDPTSRLSRLWRGYAAKVYGPDYPLYQAIALAVAEDREILRLLLECRGEAHDPNMLLASIQYLVLGGASHPLADLYADAKKFLGEPVPPEVGPLTSDFCVRYRDQLITLLNTRRVQTNETGRCGGIALGLIEAARLTGDPVAVIDAGASAGLNLALDEYLLDFGSAGRMGPEDSAVHLQFEVRDGRLPSPLRLPPISRRLGLDRTPIDLGDDDTVRWLLACIWPGTGRQKRARTAMRLAADRPGLVRMGDMVTDLPPALSEMHPDPTVVVTSWSYSYLPVGRRKAFVDVLREEGRRRPVAWVCCDLLGTEPLFDPDLPPPPGEGMPSVLGLALFDGLTATAKALGYMHSHGSWLTWAA